MMEPLRTIDSADDFAFGVGWVIFFCQCIEHDVKSIYFGMVEGMTDAKYEKAQKWTLGQTVDRLERLDNSGEGEPYFSKGDYALLRELTEIRNHYAHKCYSDWVYKERGRPLDSAFAKASGRLINDHNRLLQLSQTIEDVRVRFHQGK